MQREETVVADGHGFMISNGLGDVVPRGRQGLFQADTRFLSDYRLTLGNHAPRQLAAVQNAANHAVFYATNPESPELPAGQLDLQRERRLARDLIDRISLTNRGSRPVQTTIRFDLGADFADVLEIRAVPGAKLGLRDAPPPAGWHQAFAYRRQQFACDTLLRWSRPGRFEAGTASFDVSLRPGDTWDCELQITMNRVSGEEERLPFRPIVARESREEVRGGAVAPVHWDRRVTAGSEDSMRRVVFEQALADLRTLQMTLPTGETIIGAGVPYFMALFGRDSLLTAYQTLSLGPELAAAVLRALVRYQGTKDDPGSDQEPGKIPHEVRHGELALLGDLPHRCYYGSVDATPLFLVLFSEYFRRTGDHALRDELWPAAEAALAWIDQYGDCDSDGFVEYNCRAPRGLKNQGWKDSHDSISFADGQLATGPIALAEVQAYVFDAKLRMAELYAARGDAPRAAALRASASELRERFAEAFWLPGSATFALALDGAKRPVDAVASNAGHCLWSGIARPEHAALLAERLLEDDLFSGWGIRTLSTRMARYNPISYHNGSVWPHDTALIAEGLRRYGYGDRAAVLLRGLIDAAIRLPEHRLPELFAGYARVSSGSPVPYPDASAPQAWAAGAIILAVDLLRHIEGEADDGTRAVSRRWSGP